MGQADRTPRRAVFFAAEERKERIRIKKLIRERGATGMRAAAKGRGAFVWQTHVAILRPAGADEFLVGDPGVPISHPRLLSWRPCRGL